VVPARPCPDHVDPTESEGLMRASIYNNPLFADGLAGIIENYMGNPDRERAIARDELDMQRGQLDLENQRLQNDALRQRMAMAGRGGGGGGGSGGVDPARLGALFAQLGQPQGASPYSTGTPVTGDFIAPSQPLSFGEAMPAAMPQAMPAPPSPMAEGLSFGEIVTEPPAPVDEYTQTKMQYDALLRNPALALSSEGRALGKLLEERMKLWEPEAANPMDALDLQYKQLQIEQAQQDLAGGGNEANGLSTSARTTLRQMYGEDPEMYGIALGALSEGLASGKFQSEDEGLAYIFQNTMSEEVAVPGTKGLFDWDGDFETKRSIRGIGQPGAQGGAGPVQINTDEEFDALPSGTQFLAPDGTLRVKP
jgi:hypothetical protein